MSGQLMLIFSSTFSNRQKISDIPPILFSYIVPLAGRISRFLGGFISQYLLSDYLCHLSGIHSSFGLHVPEETKLVGIKLEEAFASSFKCRDKLCCQLLLIHDDKLKIEFSKDGLDLGRRLTYCELFRQEEQAHRLKQSIILILRKVQETWSLIHSHCFLIALRMLRACKEELLIVNSDIDEAGSDFVAFALEYVLVIKLIAEIWQHIHAKNFQVTGMASLDIMIGKLAKSLRQINYCFQGFSRDEESHLLELILLSHVLRLHEVGICSHDMLKKLHTAKSRLQTLHREESNTSDFIDELNKYSTEEGTSESSRAFPVDKLLQLFHLRPTPFCGKFRHIKADLKALHNNSENRLRFVSGLPVGILFQFILYNIPRGRQVWLRMTAGGSIQYISIDLSNFRDCNDARNFTLTLPFYATPSAASFILKACVCLELPVGEALHLKRDTGGPKHDCIQISEEVNVYFTNTCKQC